MNNIFDADGECAGFHNPVRHAGSGLQISEASKTTKNADAQPLEIDAKIIKDIPGQGAALRSQQGRRNQPL